MANNENFVQVVGVIQPLADQPSTTSTDTAGIDASAYTRTTTRTQLDILPPSEPTPTTTTTSTPISSETVVSPQTQTIPAVTTQTTTGGVTQITDTTSLIQPMSAEQLTALCKKYPNSPQCPSVSDDSIISMPPNFPNWSALDCPTMNTEIKKLEVFMATQKFTNAVADACNQQLATAKSLYNTKCVVAPTPTPTPTPTPVITPLIPINDAKAILTGGFGGGGFGSPPSGGGQPIEEEEKPNKWGWLLILLIIGGAYYLSKENK